MREGGGGVRWAEAGCCAGRGLSLRGSQTTDLHTMNLCLHISFAELHTQNPVSHKALIAINALRVLPVYYVERVRKKQSSEQSHKTFV